MQSFDNSGLGGYFVTLEVDMEKKDNKENYFTTVTSINSIQGYLMSKLEILLAS